MAVKSNANIKEGSELSAEVELVRKVIIDELKFNNCSPSPLEDLVQFNDVAVCTTDDGDLLISGSVRNEITLTTPIKASVSMKRKVLGLWVPVPCIKDFGSCDFDDLCTYAMPPEGRCVPLLEEHDIPCHCPIERGNFTLPAGQFRVPGTRWAGILAGNYKGTIKFSHLDQQLACYTATFTLD
uniref:MD-2-related lipid-recognition domain-containing protein n=1 Tax=Timema bartmani TaxID=61472 RepID=A0A7R9F8H3_9NEOP|nr:unnamed protein product [Timema bartmani]